MKLLKNIQIKTVIGACICRCYFPPELKSGESAFGYLYKCELAAKEDSFSSEGMYYNDKRVDFTREECIGYCRNFGGIVKKKEGDC